MTYGYGYPYMNSWSSWGPSYGYGSGWYGYPNTIVIVNNNGEAGRAVVYGKRAARSGMVTTPQDGTNNRTRSNYVSTPTVGGRTSDAGGRVSTVSRSQRQEDYYNRSWRNSQQSETSPSRNSNGWSNSSNRSDSYNRSSDYNSNSSFSPARSSSSDGGGTRSSAPASSGSNGRTRGRD